MGHRVVEHDALLPRAAERLHEHPGKQRAGFQAFLRRMGGA